MNGINNLRLLFIIRVIACEDGQVISVHSVPYVSCNNPVVRPGFLLTNRLVLQKEVAMIKYLIAALILQFILWLFKSKKINTTEEYSPDNNNTEVNGNYLHPAEFSLRAEI